MIYGGETITLFLLIVIKWHFENTHITAKITSLIVSNSVILI